MQAGLPCFVFLTLVLVNSAMADWQRDIPASFQRMGDYFPIRVVEAGGGSSSLPESLSDRPLVYRYNGEERSVEDFASRTHVSGLIVLHRGEILKEIYRQGSNPETRFTSWSVAKSVTATLVGIARDEGLIKSFKDSVTSYLPELEGSAYDRVTVEQVLQMSSGVEFDETYENPGSDFWVFMDDWAGQRNANGFLVTSKAAHAPGTRFNYNTAETQLLGWLIRRVTGKSVSEYLSEKIWQPMGMEDDAFWLLDGEDGMEITGIGLNARLRDYARFGQMHVTGDGLPDGWVAEATRPSGPQVDHGQLYEGLDLGYQYQWWSFPDGAFEAQGIHGQFIYVNAEKELVVVVASGWPEAWVFDYEKELYALFEGLSESL